MTLLELAIQMNHQKMGQYFPVYEEIFKPIKNEPFRLLEIGVNSGNSLRIWEEWLPNAEIVGLDNNPSCKIHESERSKVFIGEQSDVYLLSTLGSFDVVIDDGSHILKDQLASLNTLMPQMKSGSWYFIEDTHVPFGCKRLCVNYERTIIDAIMDMVGMLHRQWYPYTSELPDNWDIQELRLVDSLVGMKR